MSDLILKAERGEPTTGIEGVVFRHPRYGPVEVVQVANERLANGRWKVTMWVTPAGEHKRAVLESCELELSTLLQSLSAPEAAAV